VVLVVRGEEIEERLGAAFVHADGHSFFVCEKENDGAVFEGDESDGGHWRVFKGGETFFGGEFVIQLFIMSGASSARSDFRVLRREFVRWEMWLDKFGAFAAAGDELFDSILEFGDLLTRCFDLFG
jgi:hypothetical protein